MITKQILIVDDHPIVSEGICSLLERRGVDSGHITKAANGEMAVKMNETKHIDVAIIDYSLPDIPCGGLITRLRRQNDAIRIVIYTMHEDPWALKDLEAMNADGVVLKDDDMRELVIALESVVIGIHFYSTRYKSVIKMKEKLTERETEIIQHISEGKQSKEIARLLFISENTVEYHRKKLIKFFNACNTAHLVAIALAKGLIKPQK